MGLLKASFGASGGVLTDGVGVGQTLHRFVFGLDALFALVGRDGGGHTQCKGQRGAAAPAQKLFHLKLFHGISFLMRGWMGTWTYYNSCVSAFQWKK